MILGAFLFTNRQLFRIKDRQASINVQYQQAALQIEELNELEGHGHKPNGIAIIQRRELQERFRTIRQLNGHIVPVIDSIILRQQVGGRTIYYAKETPISQVKWLNLGRRVVIKVPHVKFLSEPGFRPR